MEAGALLNDKCKLRQIVWPGSGQAGAWGTINLRSHAALEGTEAHKSTVLTHRVDCQPSHAQYGEAHCAGGNEELPACSQADVHARTLAR